MILLTSFKLFPEARKTPVYSGYAPTWKSENKPQHNSGVIFFPQSLSELAIGITTQAVLAPLRRDLWSVDIGDVIGAYEGSKHVGDAIVLEVFRDMIYTPVCTYKDAFQILLDEANRLGFDVRSDTDAGGHLNFDNISISTNYSMAIEKIIHYVKFTYYKNGGDVDYEYVFDAAPSHELAIEAALVRFKLRTPSKELLEWNKLVEQICSEPA